MGASLVCNRAEVPRSQADDALHLSPTRK